MARIMDKPLIGVVACRSITEGHPAFTLHQKYLDAIMDAQGVAIILPHRPGQGEAISRRVLPLLDGLLLSGSPSNIEPWRYEATGKEELTDPGRDELALALIAQALPLHMPLLAICRGMQELAVATGGTLYRQLPVGEIAHYVNSDAPLAAQYAPTHAIQLASDGRLSQLLRGMTSLQVNSLHQQGIHHPGPLLQIEATAPDGVIEAVSVPHHPFAFGVQWHPEWRYQHDEASSQLFEAFLHACHQYRKEKRL
ncbi:gamma-glutamyl-gamma-aminobutyrate hydrolase family protein [Mixta tenebrionis]|uniref:gamma-glutamyl-gamma-aminobutyrate hydrolase n=1 Tax=Mixta tenebrionis TaxID=2562439 RepID=A0A506VAI1_9GAMM|nr:MULTISPECIES: gamma-glutamyl-gamma-aminobutyrate hydrolase family protein [Mixta]QHM75009.1 Gamma-glutamyl-gamma-aminobutyrate hydrolase PuuD [Mixta theicola]TPW42685.1 gamma-glutamyl-gamma-aminobutyrate hydrolase [Mixta tenebrionis]